MSEFKRVNSFVFFPSLFLPFALSLSLDTNNLPVKLLLDFLLILDSCTKVRIEELWNRKRKKVCSKERERESIERKGGVGKKYTLFETVGRKLSWFDTLDHHLNDGERQGEENSENCVR